MVIIMRGVHAVTVTENMAKVGQYSIPVEYLEEEKSESLRWCGVTCACGGSTRPVLVELLYAPVTPHAHKYGLTAWSCVSC